MIVLEGGYVATVDAAGTEYPSGHVVIEGSVLVAVGPGPASEELRDGAQVLDVTGCLVTPGLVNTHHHLYQWLTRGLADRRHPVRLADRAVPDLGAAGLRRGARRRLGQPGLAGAVGLQHQHRPPLRLPPRWFVPSDLLEATIEAALEIGVRFHPCRGSMDLGRSAGGLPPDEVVEDREAILIATEAAIDRWHDRSPAAMTRIAVAPCSPFSVTAELMREAAELARGKGVRLHTHLAETADEDEFCQRTYGQNAGGVPGRAGLAGCRTCGWRTACTWTTRRSPAWPPPAPRWRTARRPTAGSVPAAPGCAT